MTGYTAWQRTELAPPHDSARPYGALFHPRTGFSTPTAAGPLPFSPKHLLLPSVSRRFSALPPLHKLERRRINSID